MAKRIMLIVLAFTVAAVVIFTGCTPARRPMNTGDQNNRTGQTGQTGTGNNQGLGNNWGTDNGVGYNTGMGTNNALGGNNGMGNGYNNNTSYDKNTGYGTNTGLGNNAGLGNNNGMGNNNATGNTVGYNTTTNANDNLESTIEQINGVRNATVVVSGNTAYVGITLDNNTTNTTNIKNNVAQQIRSTNRAIATVYVSTDAGFINRLRNVGNGIRGGRPLSGFTTDLNNMVQRMTPTNL